MSHPESTPIYKNDFLVRSWKDLKTHPIKSMRHYDCALLVESNSQFVGVYHHPASDAYGEAAEIKIRDLKEKLGQISTSCAIHRTKNSYSQADLIHIIEEAQGIKPKNVIDINLLEFFQEDAPVDIFVTDEGIYAKMDEHVEVLVSSMQLKQ